MDILNWLKRNEPGVKAQDPVMPPMPSRAAMIGGLDFKSAVDAHIRWRSRLSAYINGTGDEQLRLSTVCRDDQCELGKWIYREGMHRFGFSETFNEMKNQHAHFHICAGHILTVALTGDRRQALRMLQSGDYPRASERTKSLLARVFVLVADGRTIIDAHSQWQERLLNYVVGIGGPHKTDALAREDRCALGQWLKGPGKDRFGGQTAFEDVCLKHVYVHQYASRIVAMVQANRREDAVRLIEAEEYSRSSEELILALVSLFSRQKTAPGLYQPCIESIS